MGESLDRPSERSILDAIDELDGISRTLISLGTEEKGILVGGVFNGECIVNATLDGRDFLV